LPWARAVSVVTVAPHNTPSRRIRVVRTLSNVGEVGLDNACSQRVGGFTGGWLTQDLYVVRGGSAPVPACWCSP
jgi:hypothetical protein